LRETVLFLTSSRIAVFIHLNVFDMFYVAAIRLHYCGSTAPKADPRLFPMFVPRRRLYFLCTRLMAREISSDREWSRIYLADSEKTQTFIGESLRCRFFVLVKRFYILVA